MKVPQIRSEYVKVISTLQVTETNLTVTRVMMKTSLQVEKGPSSSKI